jgi:hypothetical protein
LEFAIEPRFKVREKLFARLGRAKAVILAIIVPFGMWWILTDLAPIRDERIFTFTCIMFTVFLIPKGREPIAAIHKSTENN